jgi:cellobiose phosphorylase
VVAADIYALAPHVGRGGWTWYTGSAGWLYRLIVESLLGLQRKADRLRITPCMPSDWDRYALEYRYGDTVYRIDVIRTGTADSAVGISTILDGIDLGDQDIPLRDDHVAHAVEVRIGVTDNAPIEQKA